VYLFSAESLPAKTEIEKENSSAAKKKFRFIRIIGFFKKTKFLVNGCNEV